MRCARIEMEMYKGRFGRKNESWDLDNIHKGESDVSVSQGLDMLPSTHRRLTSLPVTTASNEPRSCLITEFPTPLSQGNFQNQLCRD